MLYGVDLHILFRRAEIKIINNGLFTPTIEKQVRLLLMFGVREI